MSTEWELHHHIAQPILRRSNEATDLRPKNTLGALLDNVGDDCPEKCLLYNMAVGLNSQSLTNSLLVPLLVFKLDCSPLVLEVYKSTCLWEYCPLGVHNIRPQRALHMMDLALL